MDPPECLSQASDRSKATIRKHDKAYAIEGWGYCNRPTNGSNRIQKGKYEDENKFNDLAVDKRSIKNG